MTNRINVGATVIDAKNMLKYIFPHIISFKSRGIHFTNHISAISFLKLSTMENDTSVRRYITKSITWKFLRTAESKSIILTLIGTKKNKGISKVFVYK